MILRFIDESGNLAWSSHMLDTALKSTVASVGGPPEPFVRSTWDLFYSRKLESLEYEFSRALGRALLSRRDDDAGWDLRWILGSASASQACLRYWTLAIKPGLGTEEGAMHIEEHSGLDRPTRLLGFSNWIGYSVHYEKCPLFRTFFIPSFISIPAKTKKCPPCDTNRCKSDTDPSIRFPFARKIGYRLCVIEVMRETRRVIRSQ